MPLARIAAPHASLAECVSPVVAIALYRSRHFVTSCARSAALTGAGVADGAAVGLIGAHLAQNAGALSPLAAIALAHAALAAVTCSAERVETRPPSSRRNSELTCVR